jgi:hypothetical protein
VKQFAVYNVATGVILRSGQCQEGDVELQVTPPGHAVMEITEEATLIHRSSPRDVVITPADGVVTVPSPSLAELKDDKKVALQNVANPKLDLWATPTGGLQVDDISTARINAWATQALVCKLTSTTFGLPYWIMADNSQHTFADADAFIAFASVAAGYKTAVILNHSALKKAISDAADQVALNAIDLETGWPS